MDFLSAAVAWLTDGTHWSGPEGIPTRVLEHVALSAAPLALGIAVALPIGFAIGHTARGAVLAVSVANIGRAVPSLGWLGIFLPVTLALQAPGGVGVTPTILALTALAIPPVVTNTYAGLREVDRDLIEAGRGMGMGPGQLLWRVELPLSLPIILAGVRTSAVQVVATATLGAILGSGGLGRYIVDGIAEQNYPKMFAGAVIVALLAMATELGFAALQRTSISPGLRHASPAEAPRPA